MIGCQSLARCNDVITCLLLYRVYVYVLCMVLGWAGLAQHPTRLICFFHDIARQQAVRVPVWVPGPGPGRIFVEHTLL